MEHEIEADHTVGQIVIGIAGALEGQVAQHLLDRADGHILIRHTVLDKGDQDQIGIVIDAVIPCVLGQSLGAARNKKADLPKGHAVGLKGLAEIRLHGNGIRSCRRYRNQKNCAQHHGCKRQTQKLAFFHNVLLLVRLLLSLYYKKRFMSSKFPRLPCIPRRVVL